ncbi:PREDICTED: F-box protein At1g55000-like isoform X2 [Nelumbo nucifera]|uniref:F-box protein At1g55000-like isoform X2 n=2 Tax=Nelumbo nucifera TaxID=4432 RepID=A0A1U8B910_NELNU|nr:PREDICTED: F-box protein At1g55000-like isoform X2 [Nelumbo nucifera]DAD33643.1 TPA_asm: hypothetical protein HUJ06_012494 [Nelumbo nucifera]
MDFSGDLSSATVISPMNSNFPAFNCTDILRSIFQNLPPSDLARAACVCHLWNSVASDRQIQTRAFKSPWKLKDVIGNPTSTSFWRDNSLGRFAISHRLVRGDTVASLAVKYCVQWENFHNIFRILSRNPTWGIQENLRIGDVYFWLNDLAQVIVSVRLVIFLPFPKHVFYGGKLLIRYSTFFIRCGRCMRHKFVNPQKIIYKCR